MTVPITPFWFKQRQCRAEPAGSSNVLEVSGPNLEKAYLVIAPVDGGNWMAALRQSPDGPDVRSVLAEEPSPMAAWEAAFELYRTHVIV